MTRRPIFLTLAIAAVAFVFLGGTMIRTALVASNACAAGNRESALPGPAQLLETPVSADQLVHAFQKVAETVQPSVVTSSADRHILTNLHVVRDANEVQVQLFDDEQRNKEMVRIDTNPDS